MPIVVTPIGVVRTARASREDTPVQAAANLGEQGRAVVDERYRDGLDGLAEFSHAWLLTWLGDPPSGVTAADAASPGAASSSEVALRQRPFLRPDGPPLGIFAMRGPRRPVPIGLSLVEIVGITAGTVRFRGVDVIDGTPLIDIKPYFPAADAPHPPVRAGWFEQVDLAAGATPKSLRTGGGRSDP